MGGADQAEAARFAAAVALLSADELQGVARSLQSDLLTDEVDWWRATIAIDKVLRHVRQTRQAAQAATEAVHAVQSAAVRAGLIAGLPARPVVRLLMEHWVPVYASV